MIVEVSDSEYEKEINDLYYKAKVLVDGGMGLTTALSKIRGSEKVSTRSAWYRAVRQKFIDNGYVLNGRRYSKQYTVKQLKKELNNLNDDNIIVIGNSRTITSITGLFKYKNEDKIVLASDSFIKYNFKEIKNVEKIS